MADIINLRTARKQQKRKLRERAAAQNRASHGLSSSERKAARALEGKRNHDLDGHHITSKKSDD